MKKYTKTIAALLLLLASGVVGAQALNATSTEKKPPIYTKKGSDRDPYSDKYDKEEDMLKDGACQMVTSKDGPLKFKQNKNGTGYTMGSGSSGDVEYLANIETAFSPFQNFKDRKSASEKFATGSELNAANGEYTYTHVCGKKKLAPPDYNNNSRWKAWESGFEYYDPAIQNGGKIRADTWRNAKATGVMTVAYPAWYAVCEYYELSSDCEVWALRLSEDMMCRMVILPPIKPDNNLKFAYNNAPEGPPSNSNSNKSGSSSQQLVSTGNSSNASSNNTGGKVKNDKNLPRIYDENRYGIKDGEYKSKGMSWYDEFGYDLPPLAYPQTGLPASKAVLKYVDGDGDCNDGMAHNNRPGGSACDNLDKLQHWRTAVVGPNTYYSPDGTNDMAEEAHNMSGQQNQTFDGFKLYYSRCVNWLGLNCVCDPKNFFKGTSLGYVLWRAGAHGAIDNETKIRSAKIPVPDQDGYKASTRTPVEEIAENKTEYMSQAREVPVSKNGKKFNAMLGHKVGDKPWPGDVGDLLKTGLSNAEKDDIIFYDGFKTNAAVKKRPWIAYYVDQKLEDGCLIASTMNNGTQFDSAGNTEKWGVVTKRKLCPKGSGGASGGKSSTGVGAIDSFLNAFTLKGLSNAGSSEGLVSCVNVEAGKCVEEDWDTFKVYKWYGKKNEDGTFTGYDSRQFNPDTGAECKNGSC